MVSVYKLVIQHLSRIDTALGDFEPQLTYLLQARTLYTPGYESQLLLVDPSTMLDYPPQRAHCRVGLLQLQRTSLSSASARIYPLRNVCRFCPGSPSHYPSGAILLFLILLPGVRSRARNGFDVVVQQPW